MDYENKFDHQEPHYFLKRKDILSVLDDFSLNHIRDIEYLSGGYSNINVKFSTKDKQPLVLRISNKSQRQFETEIAILKAVKNKIIVPTVYDYKINHSLLNRHVAILEFLPGTPLNTVEASLAPEDIKIIAQQLGKILAEIHKFSFDKSGFLGKKFNVVDPFISFHESCYNYFENYLENKLLIQRIGVEELQRLRSLILKNDSKIRKLTNVSSLVHSDFNQKNILVDKRSKKWEITGILDWEFSFSGSPLIDFGNFFRFEREMHKDYKPVLIKSYRQHDGCLKLDWQQSAKILDLLSLLEFLTRKGNYPKTFTTAKTAISSTISDLL
ncbi:hypothetical protein WH96_17385 [Kiloniella spongiae]|uniref:Protein kinase domain-containing protein n=1 Tax=Kiloniella spongiae TaxID=1489064 RepID=A0A0H2MAV2_9PROT|nr:aminoglycoside phosphotransferase family protein [Kiloniella spongiae]KLN59438.1 hypothetical protein WH96_17385 [Kiloniella spongiae]